MRGRLVSAGRSLGLDHTTIARRITALERAVGTQLIDRSPRGTSLTSAGLALIGHAERMEAELHHAAVALGGGDSSVSGVVRIATPEAFGTFLIARNVAKLHARHPDIRLELMPESQRVQLANRDVDLAVMLERPVRGPVIARRLTDFSLGLFASRDYLARCEPITELAHLPAHPFAWYIEELIDMPELRVLQEVLEDARTVFRSTSIAAQQQAVLGGLGLGMLHAFAAREDPDLVRLLPDRVEARRSYWLAMHKDQQRLPRIRAVIEFLDELVAENHAAF